MTTETATTTDARYIDSAEAAKMIRKNLAKAFAGVKFSVKTRRYAGGSSIDIEWTDGPTNNMVKKITDPFSGKGFDGMIDMAYSKNAWLLSDGTVKFASVEGTEGAMGSVEGKVFLPPTADAELVYFGSNYIFTDRNTSTELVTAAVARFTRKFGDIDLTVKPNGKYAYAELDNYDMNYHWRKMFVNCFFLNGKLAEVKE